MIWNYEVQNYFIFLTVPHYKLTHMSTETARKWPQDNIYIACWSLKVWTVNIKDKGLVWEMDFLKCEVPGMYSKNIEFMLHTWDWRSGLAPFHVIYVNFSLVMNYQGVLGRIKLKRQITQTKIYKSGLDHMLFTSKCMRW